ncbi:glycosyltransferase [Roseobacter sinensis]|uniref:Glycosyl transferase family 28 C-terminal domain-containing protein n=1 Tax=Roseobacter sinensis TaxID=2931391 RepID=A0ABT3BCM4_9RHOB|nr:glycosyltransferase [Roseobacter sp. WL0113]MCV3271318.1 hypothetical protein [Roseobacter sp. WL0113]
MILLCSGQVSAKQFDALLLFAAQLEGRGHPVAIHPAALPEDVLQQQKYEIAPWLTDDEDIDADTVLVIGSEAISDDCQHLLRTLECGAETRIWALGHFRTYQEEISARTKIAYATGQEPEVLNLIGPQRPLLLDGQAAPLSTPLRAEPDQRDGAVTRLLVFVPAEELEPGEALSRLAELNYSPKIDLHVLTNARGKGIIRRSSHAELSVIGYVELPPAQIINYVDVVAFFGPNVPGERMAALALLAAGAGKVVIDCTTAASFATSGAPVLKGPSHLASLLGYLSDVVLDQRLEIGRRTLKSPWLAQFDGAALDRDLKLAPPKPAAVPQAPQTLFFPTNGNGLGHAQRCALIAEAMSDAVTRRFAAFPSCIDLLERRGFGCVPMISRSTEHEDDFAADLVNYLRLRNVLKRGDGFVFDGGYVFDSVYRTISDLQIPAVWIRRGLWQAGQINPTALERERAFSRVIVPQECFPELNTDYSTGAHISNVGPIVREGRLTSDEVAGLRERLGRHFDRSVKTLVLTMLGGGVASERTAQAQRLCSLLERRPDCLHLIVAWPNAMVADGLFGWQNSHVVRTAHTLDLCQAADLTVSAVGYNSFHEILYAGVPAIFIPQSAPFLDDQERRARAAADRHLAALVLDEELLMLEREVSAFLDGSKADEVRAALREANLQTPGNRDAAELIENEVAA